MSDTFEFIKEYRNIYENATYTEKLLESASSVLELGMYENQLRKTLETMVNKLISEFNIQCEANLILKSKIDLLYEKGVIDRDSKDNFHTMRIEGNSGSHARETMDTHSSQNYYKEKREKDENAFKRLFVECHAFVEVYMPKVGNGGSASVASSVSTSSNVSSYSAKPQSTSVGSSVKYGSAQNTNVFTVKKGVSSLFMVAIVFALVFGSCRASVFIIQAIEDNSGKNIPILLCVVIYICFCAIGVWLIDTITKPLAYKGVLQFCGHRLVISGGDVILGGDLFVDNIRVSARGGKPLAAMKPLTVKRGDGRTATLFRSCKTADGFDMYIYQYTKFSYVKYNICINDLLIVEGDYINLDNLRKLENSRY